MTGTVIGKAQVVPRGAEQQKIIDAINAVIAGRSNAVGLCTLDDGETSTTVTAPNCGAGNAVFLFPTTAHAAAKVATTYVDPDGVVQGAFTITHADPGGQEDQTFFFVCLG